MSQKSGTAHKLKLSTPLPLQQLVLTVTENKAQLIDMICEQVKIKALSIPANKEFNHNLLVIGSSEVPQEICSGVVVDRIDLKTTYEEADVIIPQQMVYAVSQGAKTIIVICDDTDVCVLLLHYYLLRKLTCCLLMEGTSAAERTVIDIAATMKKHAAIIPQHLAAHDLSGCDTVARLSGLGKATVIKHLQKGHKLEQLGEPNAAIPEVIAEASSFVAACYGKRSTNISNVRFDVWLTKMAKRTSGRLLSYSLCHRHRSHSLKMSKGPIFRHVYGKVLHLILIQQTSAGLKIPIPKSLHL